MDRSPCQRRCRCEMKKMREKLCVTACHHTHLPTAIRLKDSGAPSDGYTSCVGSKATSAFPTKRRTTTSSPGRQADGWKAWCVAGVGAGSMWLKAGSSSRDTGGVGLGGSGLTTLTPCLVFFS